ncbi:MAG: low molecular weight protein-tyrosine-phosphatase [Butyrivibrio sp.]
MITRVLFVCHGNICRSPIAEFVMKSLVRHNNLSDNFFIASAATSTEEIYNGIGNPVYPPARAVLKRHGLDCGGKRAVQLVKADYDKYDYLIGMDSYNIKNMLRIVGGDPEGKVYKLMSFAGSDRDVADPWYSGDFDKAYEDIEEGCKAFLDYLTDNGIT